MDVKLMMMMMMTIQVKILEKFILFVDSYYQLSMIDIVYSIPTMLHIACMLSRDCH